MTLQTVPRFVIRNWRIDDLQELVSLPRAEGREMGQESELQTWMNVDPYGGFIAVSIDDGQISGCCCGIALSESHGYIGMYVVKNKYRGLGLGRVLWNSAIARLGGRNISLSSATKMIPFYREKAGFRFSASWTVDLYSTTNPVLPTNVYSRPLPFSVVVKSGGPFVQHVIEYDYSIHKYDRSEIVNQTVDEQGTLTLITFKPSMDAHLQATGYACMKKSLQGHWLIAPVYADDYSSALSLVHGLLSALTDEERKEGVVAKLISSNSEAEKLFLHLGMKRTEYRLQRLFTKDIFDISVGKVFALQSSVFCTE